MFTGTTAASAVIDGGDGTDTLSLAAADAATLSGAAVFEGFVSNFEKVKIGATGAATTVDMSNLDDISYVVTTGLGGGFNLTLNKFANAGTVELTAAALAADQTIVNLVDATGTADSLNVVLDTTADLTFGTVKAAGIETINVTASDANADDIYTATVDLLAAAAKTINVSGAANLVLTNNAANTAVTLIDGSTLSGSLTAQTDSAWAAGATIKGGSADDTLTSNHSSDVLVGGDGSDTLTVNAGANLVTLTGGAGNDTFVIAGAAQNSNSAATITDLAAGDIIKFAASAANFKAAKLALDPNTAVFQDYANLAITSSANGDISWFQFGGNTYAVLNVDASNASFTNGSDVIVKITGLVDLSKSSFSSSADTALYIM